MDQKQKRGLLLVAPALLLIFFFKVYPLMQGVYLSMTSTPTGIGAIEFVGMQNFIRLVNDRIFLSSLMNILKAIIVLPIFVVIPIIISFVIHQKYIGWQFFRSAYFYPYLLPPVMVGYMFSFVLGPSGTVNIILRRIGLDFLAINWFGHPQVAIYSIFGVILWSWFGLGTIIYLASMSTIPDDFYESAVLDGARPSQMLFYITIPHIVPTIGYWAVLVTTSFFIGLFPYIYALTEGGPGYATMMPEYYVYIVATRHLDAGYASALGFALFILIFGLAMLQVKYMYIAEQEF